MGGQVESAAKKVDQERVGAAIQSRGRNTDFQASVVQTHDFCVSRIGLGVDENAKSIPVWVHPVPGRRFLPQMRVDSNQWIGNISMS